MICTHMLQARYSFIPNQTLSPVVVRSSTIDFRSRFSVPWTLIENHDDDNNSSLVVGIVDGRVYRPAAVVDVYEYNTTVYY
jgi:hypothetical protein